MKGAENRTGRWPMLPHTGVLFTCMAKNGPFDKCLAV